MLIAVSIFQTIDVCQRFCNIAFDSRCIAYQRFLLFGCELRSLFGLIVVLYIDLRECFPRQQVLA
jgi:hypothetical protein